MLFVLCPNTTPCFLSPLRRTLLYLVNILLVILLEPLPKGLEYDTPVSLFALTRFVRRPRLFIGIAQFKAKEIDDVDGIVTYEGASGFSVGKFMG